RRRSLNEALNAEPKAGLLQVLAGEVAWRDVLINDAHTRTQYLPLSDSAFTARDVFGSEAMRRLVQELRDNYDLVIFDCPPVLAVGEGRIIAGLGDVTLVMARWGATQVWALRAAVNQLQDTSGNVMGVALNRVNPNAPGRTSYNDALYYYKGNK